MKLFAKLLVAVLIIGLLLPFTILKGKDGRPLMSFSSLKMPEIGLPDAPSMPESPISVPGLESIGEKNVIYEWRDSEGNIQFTNVPPPQGVEYTVKGYDPDTNVIQSVKLPAEASADESDSNEEKTRSAEPDGITSVYSPENIKKLFDDAENVEKLLNERLKKQEAIVGD